MSTAFFTIAFIFALIIIPAHWFERKKTPRPSHYQDLEKLAIAPNRQISSIDPNTLTKLLVVMFDDAYPAVGSRKKRLFYWPEDVEIKSSERLHTITFSPMGIEIVLMKSMTIGQIKQFIRQESGNFESEDGYRTYTETTEHYLLTFGKGVDFDCLSQNVRR